MVLGESSVGVDTPATWAATCAMHLLMAPNPLNPGQGSKKPIGAIWPATSCTTFHTAHLPRSAGHAISGYAKRPATAAAVCALQFLSQATRNSATHCSGQKRTHRCVIACYKLHQCLDWGCQHSLQGTCRAGQVLIEKGDCATKACKVPRLTTTCKHTPAHADGMQNRDQ